MKILNFSILLFFLLLISCKKEKNPVPANSRILPEAMATSNLPMMDGDRLHFNSFTQFDDYFDDLDFALDDPLNTDDDSLLYEIELNSLGFLSLRHEVLVRNNMDDPDAEYTSEEIENMFQCDVIGGDLLKSVLNVNHEVRIGDTLYVYFPEHLIVGVHHTYQAGISLLREIDKCEIEISDFMEVLRNPNYRIQWVRSGEVIKIVTRDVCQTYYDPVDNITYGIRFKPFPAKCDLLRFDFLVEFGKVENDPSIGDYLVPHDPTKVSISDIYLEVGENGVVKRPPTPGYFIASYSYQNAGAKVIIAGVNFTIRGNTYAMTCSEDRDVGGISCSWLLDNSGVPKTFSDALGKWKIQRKSWIEFVSFQVDYPGYRVGSWTRGFRENGNGNWKKKRTSLYTGVILNTRDYITCVPAGNIIIEDCCKIRRKIRESKRISIPYKFSDGDVYAEHELRTEGVSVIDNWVFCK